MRMFVWLLAVSLVLEFGLYGIATAFHPNQTIAFFPIFPAVWIAMGIGGVHSAGFLSLIVGIVVTALIYALIAWSLVRLLSVLWRSSGRS
jgi:hypothetical protein